MVYEKWKQENPLQFKAHRAVHDAKRRGDMVKENCEVCDEPKTDAHHDDYNKPLDVRWLCRYHHKQVHVNLTN